jgi:hypothetical protein
MATAAERDAIQKTSRRLFDGSGTGRFVAEPARLGQTLRAALRGGVTFSSPNPAIGIVQRHLQTVDLYFVANTSNREQRAAVTFATDWLRAEWWNPSTGAMTPLQVSRGTDRQPLVSIALAPYESGLVVFSDAARVPSTPRRSSPRREPIDLSTGWTLTFPGAAPAALDRLESWTDLPNRRGFSGVAVYEREFTLQPGDLRDARTIAIDFGAGKTVAETALRNGMRAWLDSPVRDAAVVHINGVRAGAMWTPPFRVAIGEHLIAGKNTIRVEVANLAINAMASKALPDYRLLNLRYGTRFEAQDMDQVRAMPAGLLGPITLVWD